MKANGLFLVLSVIFGAALYSLYFGGLAVIVYAFIEGTTFVIRAFVPDFLVPEHERRQEVTTVNEKAERKMLAVDYLIAERIKRQNDLRQHLAARFGVPAIHLPHESISGGVARGVSAAHRAETTFRKSEDDRAQWTIAKLVDGRKHYLCRKLVRRTDAGEIQNKVAYAPLRSEAIRLDFSSAELLSRVMSPDVWIEPLNAVARLAQKRARELTIESAAIEQISSTARVEKASLGT